MQGSWSSRKPDTAIPDIFMWTFLSCTGALNFDIKSKNLLPRENASYNSQWRPTSSRARTVSQLEEREEEISLRLSWDAGVCVCRVEGSKHAQAFKIETSPASKIIAQLGDSISMTCSTTHCESPAFSWAALMDRPLNGKVINEGNRSTLVTNPVNLENDYSYLCFVTCESKKRRREFSVEIYSFPKDPEIHFSGHPELGKPVTVTCFVPDVYPSDKLKIELLKGNQFLSQKEFLDPADVKSQETKSLEATFTPADEDNGTALVCRATLNVYEIDSEPQVRETTEQLHIYVSPKDTVISVSPSTRLQEGDSVTMTCSSRGLPAPQIFWRKKLDNGDLQLLSENATLTLIAMRMEDSGTYVCEGVNKVGQDREEVTLIVQEKMFTVEISPGPWVAAQIGDLVVLTCIVTGCESPSFSWRTQLDSPLSGNVNTEGSRSTLTLSPVSLEHEHSYQCAVTCGHDKELERKTQVKLYLFPRNLEIEMSGLFVSGKPVTVRCQVPDVYSFDRLEIELLKGESIMKNKTFLRDVDTKSLETKSLEMTFIPTTEDTGKVLVCQAKLSIDEMEFELKQKQNTQTLYVNVAPQVTAILVSPSSVLEEGGSVNMTCSSDGLPAPKTLWSKQLNNGDLQPLSENTTLTLMSTKMEDSGIYVCEGINQAGISRKEVELIIQVAPKDIQLTAFPSESVREGDTVIISCTCGNAPQTLIILKKKAETGDTLLKSTDGAYTIHKAQLQDAGVYECESKNEVGFQLRSITLNVKERESSKDYFSPELLVLYCASSLVIPATGMIIYFARRANMRGSYSLV